MESRPKAATALGLGLIMDSIINFEKGRVVLKTDNSPSKSRGRHARPSRFETFFVRDTVFTLGQQEDKAVT
jgi:hypothetical protein